MKFKIKETLLNDDGTKSFIIHLEKKDLVFFGYILESFEGWGNYTTLTHDGYIVLKVDVSPSFISKYEELFSYMKKY